MIHQWKLTVPKLTGWRKRRAYVYVPDSIREDPERRYPVLYMFDGHNLFFDADATYGKSWGLKEYLEDSGAPVIVAGVECNHSPRGGRLSEYSPFTFDDPDWGHINGRGRLTMDWYTKVFKRMVDESFPTIPDREHTFIGGSSMGGLMSLYAISAYNHVYSRAAALSPSLWFSPAEVEQMVRRAVYPPDTVVYMDYGEQELEVGMARRFGDFGALLCEKGILLSSRIVPGGDHSEGSWERQIPFFMETLLYNVE